MPRMPKLEHENRETVACRYFLPNSHVSSFEWKLLRANSQQIIAEKKKLNK